jgi:predicted nucleotidyltransferase
LSTVGHAAAFRAFARAARKGCVQFMVIGGTFRDVAVRAASTRDIDVVLIDCTTMPESVMREAGFVPITGAPHAWRYARGRRAVEVQIAAVGSSTAVAGPFSVAFQHAERRSIEGQAVVVPRLEDYVILKLIAARADVRRRNRDLADVQSALEVGRDNPALTIPALRARMRDVYRLEATQVRALVTLLRQVPRPSRR